MPPLRIIFMGTAELACASLKALCERDSFQIVAVVTQPDRPKGRDLKLQFSAVKELAVQNNLPILQPERARNEAFIEALSHYQPDLIVVVAYGQILPTSILDLPRFGSLNVHTSLLPKYRGAAPIQWAILNDEAETGVTVMKMDAGMDTGDILTQASTPILPSDNAQTLHDRLAGLGAELLVRTVPEYVANKVTPQPQNVARATYTRKITKEDGRIDWTQPARTLWNRIRAFTPWPGAFTFQPAEPKPRFLKIWVAEVETEITGLPSEIIRADKAGVIVGCGEQALRILSLQREGGRRLSAQEFLAGNDLKPGDQLG